MIRHYCDVCGKFIPPDAQITNVTVTKGDPGEHDFFKAELELCPACSYDVKRVLKLYEHKTEE